jgi:hypothetical protein
MGRFFKILMQKLIQWVKNVLNVQQGTGTTVTFGGS